MTQPRFGQSVEAFLKKHPPQPCDSPPLEASEQLSSNPFATPLDAEIQRARERAMVFLGLSLKPTGAVRAKLNQLGYSSEAINQAIEGLKEAGYLDDETLASRVIQKRSQGSRSESHYRLKQRLRAKGLEPDAIDRALETAPSPEALIRQWVLGKLGRIKPPFEAGETLSEWINRAGWEPYQKLMRQAASRGFAYPEVRRILRQIVEEENDD